MQIFLVVVGLIAYAGGLIALKVMVSDIQMILAVVSFLGGTTLFGLAAILDAVKK
ncbi:hypothetical protein [Hyphomicrobium sp. DY-1]|uniref:hypothetical protein n=1 Tax=Hyphomicrobium sp. DY-1 TaxID=3075650 RepID=UPI0039C42EAF